MLKYITVEHVFDQINAVLNTRDLKKILQTLLYNRVLSLCPGTTADYPNIISLSIQERKPKKPEITYINRLRLITSSHLRTVEDPDAARKFTNILIVLCIAL